MRHGPSWRSTPKLSEADQSSTISPSSMRLITIPQILIALPDLVLDADAQVPVAEEELVEAERAPDALVAVILGGVDVIVEVAAVDANGGGGVAA